MLHLINKPVGWTPLMCISALKQADPTLANTPITYAGRLDPMADGLVLLLSGEDRRQKADFLTLAKSYRATILFGLSTDTHDILGIPVSSNQTTAIPPIDLTGLHTLPLPHYASYKVQGKPLFQWAREGRLDEIDVPTRDMVVTRCLEAKRHSYTPNELGAFIDARISCVQGDFRQTEIRSAWAGILESLTIPLTAVTLDVEVTSGTYIRALAHMLGTQQKTGALLLSLTRTAIGSYRLEDATRLDT